MPFGARWLVGYVVERPCAQASSTARRLCRRLGSGFPLIGLAIVFRFYCLLYAYVRLSGAYPMTIGVCWGTLSRGLVPRRVAQRGGLAYAFYGDVVPCIIRPLCAVRFFFYFFHIRDWRTLAV